MKISNIVTKRNLLEGGNLSIGGYDADQIDLTKLKRSDIVSILNTLLLSINNEFKQIYGDNLWSPELLKSGKFLSGSSLHFFDIANITDQDFTGKKPSVGDIDTMVNKEKESQVQEFLTNYTNKEIGPSILRGFKRGNEQFSALFELTNLNIKVQIDFEFVDYENEMPTDWARFSHSSSWQDLQSGIKGVFHKFLIQSLSRLTAEQFYLRKLVGRGKARAEQDILTTDNMYSFAVSSKEGGGLRRKYEPVIDTSTGKPEIKDGLPVLKASPAEGYIKNISQIFGLLFGKRLTRAQLEQVNQNFWSYTGLIDIVKTYASAEDKKTLVEAFLLKLFGPGSQGLYKNNPDRDIHEKSIAFNYLLKTLNMSKPSNFDEMLERYRASYKVSDEGTTDAAPTDNVVKTMAKRALDEDTPNYKRVGIPHIYNPGSTVEIKDADFIELCKEIASMGGKLDNVPINLKIDGAGIRFGKNEQGKPFFSTSKVSEKYIENIGDFEKFSRETGKDQERIDFAKNYDNAMKIILTSDFVKLLPPDTIVQAEMLFMPMGKKDGDSVTFVSIPYDVNKLGTAMTLTPFSIKTYSTGEPKPNADKIKEALLKTSNSQVKMINNRLSQSDVDVSKIVNPIAKNATELLSAVKIRGENPAKTKAKEILSAARQQLSLAIINSPIAGKDQLGKNFEGLVLNLPSGRLVKVTSTEMKAAVSAKQAAKASTTNSNRVKPAVVTVGSFVGHKGHQQLINYTISYANKIGGDAYVYVSPVVGIDDPIPADIKVQTLRKLYPSIAQNIQVWPQEGTAVKKIEKELVLPPNSPYNKIVLLVGSDRYEGFKKWMDRLEQRMKDPAAVAKFGGTQHLVDFETIRTERDENQGGTGISFTKLRNVLNDSTLSEEQKLEKWAQAFDSETLGIEWIKKLMDITKQNMNITKQRIKKIAESITQLKSIIPNATSKQKQKIIPLLQESISVLKKLKENDSKEEKIKSLDIDRKSANLTSDETKVFQNIIRMYPEASDPLSAIIKYVIHSIEQSDSEDYHHEKRLSSIEKNIRKLEKELNTFHSKDDLTKQEVEEATLINDPEQGHLIVPDGGMGTWDEKSLLSNLIRKFSSMAEMIKEKRYSSLYHSLYEAGVVENMLKALIQYENFKEKQGNRPIAKGKKIELKEIDFSSGLDDRNFSVKKILEIGKVVGQIEGYDVVKATAGSQKVYFLVSDDNVHSLIGFDNGYLKNIKNVSKQSGVVRALLGYLVHIQKQPIEISHTEPLTSDGLRWVIHLIEKPRGLVITNQDNEPINVEELKNEWDQATETGNPGTTSITITEDTKFGNKIRTNESYRHSDSLLMPFIFYTKNQDYLTEK